MTPRRKLAALAEPLVKVELKQPVHGRADHRAAERAHAADQDDEQGTTVKPRPATSGLTMGWCSECMVPASAAVMPDRSGPPA